MEVPTSFWHSVEEDIKGGMFSVKDEVEDELAQTIMENTYPTSKGGEMTEKEYKIPFSVYLKAVAKSEYRNINVLRRVEIFYGVFVF